MSASPTIGGAPVDDDPPPAAGADAPPGTTVADETEEAGREILLGTVTRWKQGRDFFRRIPSSPRCKLCAAPFKGVGAPFMRAIDKGPYPKNPMYCSACFKWLHKHQAGAEIECSLLFADVRGSTTIAEHMRPAAFRQLMEQFFARSSQVIVDADGLVDKFVGDEVVAIFIPALTGADHARRAIDAARRVVSLMAGEDGAHLLPVGAGVHAGIAYVGSVGGSEQADFTAMGDPVNVTARLASAAGAGEVLVTLAAAAAAGLPTDGLEHRNLTLKGRSDVTEVVVLGAA
jgi:adenylate cyclase